MQSVSSELQNQHVRDGTVKGKYPKIQCRQDRQRLFHSEKLGAAKCPMESVRCTVRRLPGRGTAVDTL